MGTPTFVIGDDIELAVTLKKNGAVFNLPTDSVVKARLISANHETPLSGVATQASNTPGADWTQSLVIVKIPAASNSMKVKQQSAKLEIQAVTTAGTTSTWFVPGNLVKGLIT